MHELYSLFTDYRQEAAGLGNQSLSQLLERADVAFKQNTLEIAFIGRMSVGKSSLINRLLGRDLLPTAAGPTTTKLTFLRRGPEDVLLVNFEDGAEVRKPATTEAILEHASRADVLSLTVELADFPHDRVTWVDTPGVEDLNDHRVDVTYGYLPTADAVVFVLDSAPIFTQRELDFYQQKIMATHKDKVFLALNKFDLVSDDETPESLLERVADHLGEDLRRHQTHVVSTRKSYPEAPALLDAFRADLDAYLSACDKQAITREKVRSLVDQAHASVLEQLNVSLGGLGKEVGGIQAEIAQLDADRAEAEAKLQELEDSIQERLEAVREAALESFNTTADLMTDGIGYCHTPDEKLRYLQKDAPAHLRTLTTTLQDQFEELRKTNLSQAQVSSKIHGAEGIIYSQFQHLDKGLEILWHLMTEEKAPVAPQGGKPASKKQAQPVTEPKQRDPFAPDGRAFVRGLVVSAAGWAANSRLEDALKQMLQEFKGHLERTFDDLAESLRAEAEFAGKALLEGKRAGLVRQLEMLSSDAAVAAQTREAIEDRKQRLEQSHLALMTAL